MRPNRSKIALTDFFWKHPDKSFGRQELAGVLGLNLHSVSTNLTVLRREGVVERTPENGWRLSLKVEKPKQSEPPLPMYVEVAELKVGGTLLQRDDGTLWIANRFVSPIERLRGPA